MAIPLQSSQRDHCYPRSRKLRIFREFLRFWWSIFFLVYIPMVISNLFTLSFESGFNALFDGSRLISTLLLSQLIRHPQAIIPVILILSLLVSAGNWAHHDRETERRVLREREDDENRTRTLLQAQITAREQAYTSLRSTLEHHLSSLKPVEEAVPEVLGPPFDEVLLPLPAHFVGRSSDLKWLLERLSGSTKPAVIALRGLGGIGKTTLASIAVRQMREEGHFRDGIVVLFCQGLTDATDILRRVLTRFDPQRRQPRVDDFTGLVNSAHRLLAGKRTLVVLDDVEPELAVEKIVVPLNTVGATVLLTARQVLPHNIVPIESIHVLSMLSSEEALDLFAQSSGRNSSLDLSIDERSTVKRIVEVLDCHTLAVRLTGAYAVNTSRDLKVLARELEEDPQRAIEIPEGITPKTLALVLNRSVGKLSLETRQLYVTLAVFKTTEFSRRAASALAKELRITNPGAGVDVLILLALLDSSTDINMPEESDRERLRLHPLIHAFVAAEFALWSEEKKFRAFHTVALYYSEYTNRVSDRALGIDEDNIIGALEWARKHEQYELVAAICSGIRSFWLKHWRSAASLHCLPIGVSAAEIVYNTTKKLEDGLRRANLSLTYAQILARVGRINEARQLFDMNLAAYHVLGDRSGEGRVLTNLGLLAWRHGTVKEAETHLRKALANACGLQKRQAEGVIMSRLGRLLRRRGQLQEAEDYYLQALDITYEVQDKREQSVVLISLGQVARDRSRFEDAQQYYKQALNIAHQLQDPRIESAALSSLGQISLLCREFQQAKVYFSEALSLVSKLQDRQGEGIILARLGELARQQGQLDQARHYYEQSLSYHREIQAPRDESIVLGLLGQLARDQGQLKDAQHYYERSLAIRWEVQDLRGEGVILAALGQLAQDRGEMDLAEQLYCQGLGILHEQDAINYAAAALSFGTFLIQEQQKHDEGCKMLLKALQIYTEMGLPHEKETKEVIQRLGCKVPD